MLERLGLLAWLEMDRATALPTYGNRAWWGTEQPHEQSFLQSRFGHGYRLDRSRFDAGLAVWAGQGGVQWLQEHRVREIRRTRTNWQVITIKTSGDTNVCQTLEADFLVDASGRRAWLARRCGAEIRRSAPLVALCWILNTTDGAPWDSDSYINVEACEHGWWYALVLPGGALSLMYFTDPATLPPRRSACRDYWQAGLAQAPNTAARVVRQQDRLSHWRMQATTAGTAYLERPYGDGWLAVGDAAQAFDSLASQGIGNAMSGGYYAAHAIADHLQGRTLALPAYDAVMQQGYARYREELPKRYAQCNRWPQAPFWAQRNSASA